MTSDRYKEGLIDGEIKAIKEILATHKDRLDMQEARIRSNERITFGILGVFSLLQVIPILQRIF